VPFGNGDLSGIENNNVNWGNLHHVPSLGANNCSVCCIGNFGYGSSETNFGQGSSVYGRNVGSSSVSNLNQSTNGYARNFGDSSVGGGSIYGDTTWTTGYFEHDVTKMISTGYIGH
jgi:RNA-binding protein Musashi